jgi:hypothetical protein
MGALSKQGDSPEKVSGICAVLAETDVINMVSRGVSAPNILRGIHSSMADRLAKLIKSVDTVVAVKRYIWIPRSGQACRRARFSQGQGVLAHAVLRPSLTYAVRVDRGGG